QWRLRARQESACFQVIAFDRAGDGGEGEGSGHRVAKGCLRMLRPQPFGVCGELSEAAPIALREQDVASLAIRMGSQVGAARRAAREILGGPVLSLFEAPDVQREDRAKLELSVGHDA